MSGASIQTAVMARPTMLSSAPDEMRLEIFERVPSRAIVFAVNDGSCMPLVERGEVLVVEDAPRTYPEPGQWYLMQWIIPPRHDWERARVGQTIGIPREIKDGMWAYHPPCPGCKGVHYCGDGWFSWDQMVDYIRGPVRGVYRPPYQAVA